MMNPSCKLKGSQIPLSESILSIFSTGKTNSCHFKTIVYQSLVPLNQTVSDVLPRVLIILKVFLINWELCLGKSYLLEVHRSLQIAFFCLRWSSNVKICLAQVRKCL